MAAPFPPSANTAARLSVTALVAAIALGVVALVAYPRTPWATGLHDAPVQPVQFDHRHHVGDLGIDCRYCHTGVETSPFAGIPPTSTCLNCHAQVWNRSAMTGAIRAAYFADRPIRWVRVNNLPDFVYFDHSVHVRKGVGCVSCHGRVDTMPTVEQAAPMTMQFCLDCHRDPAPRLRPVEEVTNMLWTPPADARAFGEELARRYRVHTRISCTTCHR